MKISVTFKTPEAVERAIEEAVSCELAFSKLDADDREEVEFQMSNKAETAIKKWVRYSELVTVEFDADAGTATVMPVSQ